MHAHEPFSTYLDRYRETIRFLFRERLDQDRLNLQRGLPPFLLKEILALRPLDASIPIEHGGRGSDAREILAVLEASSYESLPLSLIMGISGALFTEPMAKYADQAVAAPVFARLRNDGALGGLMITEPGFGTDALGMVTSYASETGGYRIHGEKHWAGLSGWADYWIVTARRRGADGALGRDVGFFFCDSRRPGQLVRVEEYYNNLGLYMIPYGRNHLDLSVPSNHKLEAADGGIRLMQDLLHRSRMRFPGMALGFIRRLFDEAASHARERFIGGKPLAGFDQVQRRLSELQGFVTTAAAFCRDAANRSGLRLNLVKEGLAANIHKALMSDYMQRAAQSVLQLVGAKGYRQDHFAGRATTDSRPFQIFEGSNDVMYQQIADRFLKSMHTSGERSLTRFLADHPLTARGIGRVRDLLNFSVSETLSQRRLVDFGRILSRVTAIDWITSLLDRGFDRAMVENAFGQLREEIGALVGTFVHGHSGIVAERSGKSGDWLGTV